METELYRAVFTEKLAITEPARKFHMLHGIVTCSKEPAEEITKDAIILICYRPIGQNDCTDKLLVIHRKIMLKLFLETLDIMAWHMAQAWYVTQ
jgi:hypothetical protein